MEAPEIIDDLGSELSFNWHTKNSYKGEIQYTRTDAFVEKVVEWLRTNWREYVNVDKDGVICFGHWEGDFRKTMKE